MRDAGFEQATQLGLVASFEAVEEGVGSLLHRRPARRDSQPVAIATLGRQVERAARGWLDLTSFGERVGVQLGGELMRSVRRVRVFIVVSMAVSLVVSGAEPADAAPTIDLFEAELVAAPDLVRLSWETSGAAEAYLFGASDERGVNPIGTVEVDDSVEVVTGWGVRSYTLGVKDAAGVWRYQSVDTAHLGNPPGRGIRPPTPVTITSDTPWTIDYFRSPNIDSPLPDHTITWDMNGATEVKIRACVTGGSCTDVTPDPPTVTSYVVRGNDLAAVQSPQAGERFEGLLGPSGQGEVIYEVTACTSRPDGTPFCGEPVLAPVRVLPAQTTSTFREYRNSPVFLGHTVSWSANGANFFFVDAPTLGVHDVVTQATSFTFTAAQLNNAGPGLHTIRIKSCKGYTFTTIDCAGAHEVRAMSAGPVTGLIDPPEEGKETSIWPRGTFFAATIATINGQPQVSSRGGTLLSTCDCEGENVAAGTVLATVETFNDAVVQLQLGGGQTWTTRAWTEDFDSEQSSYLQANQLKDVLPGGRYFTANGTSILPNGDIYALGEFTTSAVVIEDGQPDTRPLPFLSKPHPLGSACTPQPRCTRQPVTPFGGGANQTHVSNSQDSFKDSTGNIWSTQGWFGGRAELQRVTVNATSGNWRLTFAGQQTANITSEATAATVQTRLESLSNIDVGEVTVTGAEGGPYTITFRAELAADVPQLTAQNVSLNSGASLAVTTTQKGVHNHSRVYRYDPTATDSDLTLQDDRMCAYNVPGNQNDVIGVTNGGGRTWFIESGWSALSPPKLTWFNPDDPKFSDCAPQNTFDYGNAASPISYPPGPNFDPGYCATPQSTDCYDTVAVPPALGRPGHLTYDAAENAIWTSTYTLGGPSSLGRYDIAADQWSVYPLPAQVTQLPPWTFHTLGGSSTWEISQAGNYVYINDHTDSDIIRFDKTAPRANCANLTNEAQRITVNATAGTWTATLLDQVTEPIDSEAAAATVQSRLEALPNIEPGNIAVTGPAGGPYAVSFQGTFVAKDVAQLRATNVSLTGDQAKTSVTTTQGGGQNPCMSEVHLPSFWTWQSIAHGTRLYWTGTGPTPGIAVEPYINDDSKFGFIDLNANTWGAITTYTGLETLVAPERARTGPPTMSWFDIEQTSGMIAIGQPLRGQFLRLIP